MRRLALLAILLVAALVAAAAGGAAAKKPAPLRFQISFSGSATGRFQDVERWIFLEENECYLRRTRDQQVQLTWSGGWSGAIGKALRSTAAGGHGAVSGSEARDTCDEDELPPDPPDNWIASLSCSDSLAVSGVPSAVWGGTAARPVLTLSGPTYRLGLEAVCSAIPRTTELVARIPLSRATLARLAPGKSLVFQVGSAVGRYGDYTPQANCQHNAKPYEGYRSEDNCGDLLTWSGQVRITRLP